MHIEPILHTGVVRTTGDLTGSERFVRVSPPTFTLRIGIYECEDKPEAWVEPLASDVVVDALVEAYRGWLIAQR